jgi:alkylresorcinol/alkylpyrone synthase
MGSKRLSSCSNDPEGNFMSAQMIALETAVPKHRFTQKECLEILQNSRAIHALDPVSMRLLERVLTNDNGIESRHFSLNPIEALFSADADFLNGYFQKSAPALAQAAFQKVLESQGLRSDEVDALLVCTCTGYLCPGISSYVAESMKMRSDVYLQDLVGLGCGAAIPLLRSAEGYLAAHPEATVVCIAVEISSAAFYLDEDPGVLISAALFGDGAAAMILKNKGENAGQPFFGNFKTVHAPEHRDLLRFEMKKGCLRNLLHRTVPEIASKAVKGLWDQTFQDGDRPSRVISHAGGRDVIEALATRLKPYDFAESREVLRKWGNMSSTSVLFALKEGLPNRKPDEKKWWLTSFGAGFTAHSVVLEWE